jgi:hypothetical protein
MVVDALRIYYYYSKEGVESIRADDSNCAIYNLYVGLDTATIHKFGYFEDFNDIVIIENEYFTIAHFACNF